jgi:ribonuclease D
MPSIQAQVQAHLGVQLDKGEQRSDWSHRPLTIRQLRYAALDAVCTLLLYEDQTARGLSASYQVREMERSLQTLLLLSDASAPAPGPVETPSQSYALPESLSTRKIYM